MSDRLIDLKTAVDRWRSHNITDHWVVISYMGPILHRVGDHTVAQAGSSYYHAWDDGWRELKRGGDFWLYTVPGSFAWARDMITKVVPADADPSALSLQYDDTYGYVKHMTVRVAKRDQHNFTFDVRSFNPGRHPEL